jgi:hypothetical protein
VLLWGVFYHRSVLTEATLKKYIEPKRREREEEEKRKKMEKASRKIDDLAKKLGNWNAQRIIRKFRDTNLKGDSK